MAKAKANKAKAKSGAKPAQYTLTGKNMEDAVSALRKLTADAKKAHRTGPAFEAYKEFDEILEAVQGDFESAWDDAFEDAEHEDDEPSEF